MKPSTCPLDSTVTFLKGVFRERHDSANLVQKKLLCVNSCCIAQDTQKANVPLFHGLSCKAFAQQCTLPASLGIEQQQCGESLHELYLLLTHDAGGKKKWIRPAVYIL